jgi:DNA-binding response OmpR family regulator
VEPDANSQRELLDLLHSAGYDASPAPSQAEGFKIVRNGGVDLFVLSADLMDLQCCNALAEIKGLAATASTRVILLTRGGGAERARALDLGADDVLSTGWEPAELLARVRVQLKAKRANDDLLEKSRLAAEGQEIVQTRNNRKPDCGTGNSLCRNPKRIPYRTRIASAIQSATLMPAQMARPRVVSWEAMRSRKLFHKSHKYLFTKNGKGDFIRRRKG